MNNNSNINFVVAPLQVRYEQLSQGNSVYTSQFTNQKRRHIQEPTNRLDCLLVNPVFLPNPLKNVLTHLQKTTAYLSWYLRGERAGGNWHGPNQNKGTLLHLISIGTRPVTKSLQSFAHLWDCPIWI